MFYMEIGMGKKKCCRKYKKTSKHCKQCPIKTRQQCQTERRNTEMSKKKDEKKKADKKKCCKKACKKGKKKSDKKKGKKGKKK